MSNNTFRMVLQIKEDIDPMVIINNLLPPKKNYIYTSYCRDGKKVTIICTEKIESNRIMTTGILNDLFKITPFPIGLCNIINDEEENVIDSNIEFICLIKDVLDPDILNIKILKPYTSLWKGDDDKDFATTLYGWHDRYGNYYDHFENGIHDDDTNIVIAFRKL